MSKALPRCPFCLQGLCRKHPLQDHGARISSLKSQIGQDYSQGSIHRTSSQLIQEQIDRLRASAKGTSESDQQAYRENMEKERFLAEQESKKRKLLSNENSELLQRGLNPSVASIMAAADADDLEDRLSERSLDNIPSSNRSGSSNEAHSVSSKEPKSKKKRSKEKLRKEKKHKKKKSSKKEKR